MTNQAKITDALRAHVLGVVMAEVANKLTETIVDAAIDLLPNWSSPSVFLSRNSDGDALFVSCTEEDEFDQYLPWDKFAADVLGSDKEVIERYLPKFELLLEQMRSILESP